MRVIITNAFSLSMLDRDTQRNRPGDTVYENPRYPYPVDEPVEWLADCERVGAHIESAVGHADTALLFSTILGRPVAVNRISIKLDEDTRILVGQYIGPRLPEGATTLHEGARIEWWTI